MEGHRIEPHKITKPIQLMAVWFVTLLLLDSSFLFAASQIRDPSWVAPALVISAIAFVPLFVLGVFLMQTVFRKELQEDQYYSEWLKKKEENFKNFSPENIEVKPTATVNCSFSNRNHKEELETLRINKYQDQQGLFLVHSWRPSRLQDQVADIVIWIHQHGDGPLTRGQIDKVEYELGPKFFDEPQEKRNAKDQFRLDVSAYGPMLCLARVSIKGKQQPIILERYIDFE